MKYILSVFFLFFFASAFSQVYQEMPQYGYRANRMAFDSTLQIPTTCGVPTIKSVVSTNKKSAIAFDSCNNRFYYYNPVTLTWILLTGGGQTIVSDTAKVVIAQVRNIESTTLNVGEVVYLKSSTGNIASVKRASNKDDSTSSRTIGVVRASIAPNATGYVTTQGQCEKMNLGSFAEGDILWLDSIAGGFTKTKPIAPYHGVFIGIVERANQGNGIAYIKPANGFELSEIHDVQIINPLNNQILVYSDTQKIWKNRNPLDTTSLSNRINTKLAIADTSNKWVNSVTKVNDTTIRVIKNTTTTDFVITGRVIDTTSLSSRINTKLAIADTSNKWVNSVTKLNDSTIRVIKNSVTTDLLIRGNPENATGSNGLSGTSTIKLGGNLDNGTTSIESTTDGLSSISLGATRKLDAFSVKNNQTTINSNNDIFLIQPTSGTDTSTYKPLGIASNGKISKINNWFGSTATTLDTSNRFVNNVTKVNDSTIRIWKGSGSSDLLIRGNATSGGNTLQNVLDAGNTFAYTYGNIQIADKTGFGKGFVYDNSNWKITLGDFVNNNLDDWLVFESHDLNKPYIKSELNINNAVGEPYFNFGWQNSEFQDNYVQLKPSQIELKKDGNFKTTIKNADNNNQDYNVYLPINKFAIPDDTLATLYDLRNLPVQDSGVGTIQQVINKGNVFIDNPNSQEYQSLILGNAFNGGAGTGLKIQKTGGTYNGSFINLGIYAGTPTIELSQSYDDNGSNLYYGFTGYTKNRWGLRFAKPNNLNQILIGNDGFEFLNTSTYNSVILNSEPTTNLENITHWLPNTYPNPESSIVNDTLATTIDIRNSVPFKTYSASLSDLSGSGNSFSVNYEFLNQIGTITTSFTGNEYILNCTGCFPENKTFISKPNFQRRVVNIEEQANAYRYSDDEIRIQVTNFSGITLGFSNMMLEIKVYN